MAETQFNLAYDGPALELRRMPVEDLAPALFALGGFFAEASRTIYPDREPAALSIEATDAGSFLVRLILETKAAWDAFQDLFDSAPGNALANLEAIGFALFLFIKRVGKKKIVAQDTTPDPGQIRVTLDDGTTVEIPTQVLTLYENVELRLQARRVVAPLHRDGVDVLRLEGRPQTVIIEKSDLEAFDLPAEEEPLLEHEIEMLLEILRLSFHGAAQWRFTDGTQPFSASVADQAFLDRVERGEAFRKGDILRCRVRITQTQRDGKINTERRIFRVVDHIPGGQQLRLGEAE